MTNESTMHNAFNRPCMFVFAEGGMKTKKKPGILFAFTLYRGQEKFNFASKE